MTAEDCIASLKRWQARDAMGRTFEGRLRREYELQTALRVGTMLCAMPDRARLAAFQRRAGAWFQRGPIAVLAETEASLSPTNLLRILNVFRFSYVIILRTTLLVRWLRGLANRHYLLFNALRLPRLSRATIA